MLWTDIATWVGPTTARSAGAMANPPRGLVLHIASGFYEGTISWQRRSSGSNRTSSHFIVARDGRCAQMVDTADGSWAQKSGNNTWLSIELEGFAPDDGLHANYPGWETATPQQVEACARLFARTHQVYGVPLQLATSPDGRGLGHHSMGAESGVDWGHSACPGTAIKGQKPAILARAIQIANGDNDMDLNDSGPGAILPGATNRDVLRSMLGLLISQATGTRRDDLIKWNAKDVPDNFWPALRQLAAGGVDLDALADKVSARLAPTLPTLDDLKQLVDTKVREVINQTHLSTPTQIPTS